MIVADGRALDPVVRLRLAQTGGRRPRPGWDDGADDWSTLESLELARRILTAALVALDFVRHLLVLVQRTQAGPFDG